jgi:hypothetical protein
MKTSVGINMPHSPLSRYRWNSHNNITGMVIPSITKIATLKIRACAPHGQKSGMDRSY